MQIFSASKRKIEYKWKAASSSGHVKLATPLCHTQTHIHIQKYIHKNYMNLQQHQLFDATCDNRTCGTYHNNCLLLLVTKELVEVPEGTQSSKLDTFRCWRMLRAETHNDITFNWHASVVYRGGVNAPKFRSFDEVELDCKLSGKCSVFLFRHRN
jgi:hypothetical protein